MSYISSSVFTKCTVYCSLPSPATDWRPAAQAGPGSCVRAQQLVTSPELRYDLVGSLGQSIQQDIQHD